MIDQPKWSPYGKGGYVYIGHRPGWTRIMFHRRGDYPEPKKGVMVAIVRYALVRIGVRR